VFDQVQSVAPHMVDMFNDIDGHAWTEPIIDKNDFNYFLCVRRITLDSILTTRVQLESNVNFIRELVLLNCFVRMAIVSRRKME
jgi:hypothetical protein